MSDYVTKTNVLSALSRFKENTDNLYETKADANDLKSAIDSNTARIENLEQEHGGLVITQYRGSNLVPSGKAKNAKVVDIVGKSRPWNNLAKELNSTNWQFNNATGSFSDGVATFTVIATRGNIGMNSNDRTLPNVANKNVLISVMVKTTTATTSVRLYAYGGYCVRSCVSSTSWQRITAIVTTSASWGYDLTGNNRATVEDARTGSWDAVQVKDWVVRDLSLIAPEYTPSGSIDSDVASLVAKMPDLLVSDSYGYSLVDTVVEGVEIRGKNLVSAYVSQAGYWTTTGWQSTGSDYKSSQKIKVNTGSTLVGSIFNKATKVRAGYLVYSTFANEDDTSAIRQVTDNTITIQAGENYVAVRNYLDNSSLINADNYLYQLEVGSSATAYSDPFTDTLSLPSPVTLRSAGSGVNEVADELDVESGVPTENVLRVNLGDLDWRGDSTEFYANIPNAVLKTEAPSTCGRYVEASSYSSMTQGSYYIINGYISTGSVALIIKDSSYSTYSDFKTAMNGVYFNIEKATPTKGTSIGTSNPMIATEGGGTINTIQTQTPVIDNCLDVAYLAL